jgi:HlyD family secretion protein
MTRKIIIAIAALLLVGLGMWGYQRLATRQQPSAAAPTEMASVTRGPIQLTADGTGSLAPPVEVTLAFKSGERLATVPVSQGQTIQPGEVLAQLETADLELQVAQVEASLAQAEAKLAETRAGPRAEDIAAAEAALRSAQANYDKLASGAQAEDIAAAEAALRLAQANHAKIAAGFRPEELTMAAADVEKAAAAVQKAQADYDRVAWSGNVGTSPQALTLQQATLDYEKAKAAYELKLNSPLAEDLAAAQAQVDQAQAQLMKLQNGPAPEELAIAQAQIDQAQAQLVKLRNGPTPEELAIAQAQMDQARAVLDQARLKLADATLVAPMAGMITGVLADPGEMVSAGLPVITLRSMQALQVEINLDETDVARISVGQSAQVTLDAFPGVELAGRVDSIAPSAVVQSGVVLYLVTISLNPTDLPLRPGMTTNVVITIERRENTLLVPFRAVETEGGQAYVTRVVGSASERVPVTLGLITETEVEILSGLAEGEVVAVYANPRQDTNLQTGMGEMFRGGQ